MADFFLNAILFYMKISWGIRLRQLKYRISWPGILDLLVETSYLAVILIVPLWFAYIFPTYNVFEFNKFLIFKLLVLILGFFSVLRIFFAPGCFQEAARLFKKYWLVPMFFLIGLSFTILFSNNPTLSFYGIVERKAGLLSYIYYLVWFALVSFNLLVKGSQLGNYRVILAARIHRVLVTITVAVTISSIYGLLQILGIDFIFFPEAAFESGRISSTLGQPNFLASWLVMVIPITIYLIYCSHRWLLKFFLILAVAAQLLCLFLTGSRGGMLAFLFGLFVYLLYVFVMAAWSRRFKIVLAVGFLVFSFALMITANAFRPGRIGDILDFDFGSVGARANFYRAAADVIGNRPFFGYGLEGGGEIFIQYYEADWAVTGDVGQSSDRAHNIVLDILITSGAFGLLLFVILYFNFFSLARQNIRHHNHAVLNLSLVIGVSAYLFSLLFSFTIIGGEVYFWLYFALIIILNYIPRYLSNEETLVAGAKAKGILAGPCLIGRVSLVIIFCALISWQVISIFHSLVADYYFNKVYYTFAKKDYFSALALDSQIKAQHINSVDQESYDYFWAEHLSVIFPSIEDSTLRLVMAQKLQAVEESLPRSGYKNIIARAKINNVLGDYKQAHSYIDSVIALSPFWPLAYMEQASIYAHEGKRNEAVIAYNMALLNIPDTSDGRLNKQHLNNIRMYVYAISKSIADLYLQDNNYPAAAKFYQSAYANNPADFVLMKSLADTYYLMGNINQAVIYTKHGLARNPGDYTWSFLLAILYNEQGNRQKALQYLDDASRLSPNNPEIKNLKESILK